MFYHDWTIKRAFRKLLREKILIFFFGKYLLKLLDQIKKAQQTVVNSGRTVLKIDFHHHKTAGDIKFWRNVLWQDHLFWRDEYWSLLMGPRYTLASILGMCFCFGWIKDKLPSLKIYDDKRNRSSRNVNCDLRIFSKFWAKFVEMESKIYGFFFLVISPLTLGFKIEL